MTLIDPNLKKFAEKFNLNYNALAEEAPKISAASEKSKHGNHETSGKAREDLPDGRYKGKVYIDIDQVKKETSSSFNRLMLKFSLKVTEGEIAGHYDYLYFVVNPAFLDEPKTNQSKEEWEKSKEDYWMNIMKTLQNCGAKISWDNEIETFSNAPDANGNIVQFTVKTQDTRRYVYIDRLVEKTSRREEDSTASLLNLPDMPDGDDAPFGEDTNLSH